jgi:choline kinase
MCGGKYKDFEKHKALSVIHGEVLVERTIRLLKENNITNWYISTNDPNFDKYGNILHHENNYECEGYKSTGYWVDAFYPTEEPTIYLHGDVYYTDDAMKKILNLNPKVNTLIGNDLARNKQHIDMGEPFGWIVVDQKAFRENINKTKKLQDEKKLARGIALSWELYRVSNGLNPDRMEILDESYLSINDKTIDVDTPEQIELVNKGLR